VTSTEYQVELARQFDSRQEARWVLEEVVGKERLAAGAVELSAAERLEVEELIRRRLAGLPLAYVLGHWSFRTLELVVDERVLVPRPETEVVVEVALRELRRLGAGRTEWLVADLGTGSGAIALSVAVEAGSRAHRLEVWAGDLDEGALAVAEVNRQRLVADGALAPEVVHLARGSWFEALPEELAGRLSMVVSNPPYVSAGEYPTLEREVRAEPQGALVAADAHGTAGFADLATLVVGAPAWLAEDGALVLELAPPQADPAVELALASGYRHAEVLPDLAGRPRVLVARR
jgi:release factor glutamine methyltransferase